jgi:hypothetical protein
VHATLGIDVVSGTLEALDAGHRGWAVIPDPETGEITITASLPLMLTCFQRVAGALDQVRQQQHKQPGPVAGAVREPATSAAPRDLTQLEEGG